MKEENKIEQKEETPKATPVIAERKVEEKAEKPNKEKKKGAGLLIFMIILFGLVVVFLPKIGDYYDAAKTFVISLFEANEEKNTNNEAEDDDDITQSLITKQYSYEISSYDYCPSYEDDGVEEMLYEISAPKINVFNTNITTINTEIETLFNKYKGYVVNNEDCTGTVAVLNYESYYDDEILSIKLKGLTGPLSSEYGNPEYVIYNINLDTYEKLTNEQLLSKYGLVLSETNNLAKEKLKEYLENGDVSYTTTEINTMVNSMSEIEIDYPMYLNASGKLELLVTYVIDPTIDFGTAYLELEIN